MQWLIDQWHWVAGLLSGGGFGAITGVIALRTAGKKREVAALERETAREERMAALEKRIDDRDNTITDLRKANEACEARGEECDRRTSQLEAQRTSDAEAIRELQDMLLRDGREVRRRVTPSAFPAVQEIDDISKDRWDD